jgi:O-antigen/teichoic acid export membrane protein
VPFLQLLSLSGLDSAAYHYAAKGRPWAFVEGLLLRLRWSLLAAAAFILVALYWFRSGAAPLGWMFLIAGLSFPVTYGLTASAGMLGAQEKFTGLFWYRLGESLTDFTGFIPLALSAWWISQAITFFAANQAASALMQVGVSLWLVAGLRRSSFPPLPPEERREMVNYGKHLTALTGISVLQARTDALLVGLLLPLETMADYSIALVVTEQFKRLWGIYVSVRYPPLVRLPVPARRRRFIREGGLVWVSFTGLGILVALAAHLLVPLILPPSYASSLGYMDILIATVLVGLPGALAEQYFRTQQDQGRQYQMRVLAAAVGVAAPALLILPFGAYGAAAGRLVANLVLSVLGIWLFLREPVSAETSG